MDKERGKKRGAEGGEKGRIRRGKEVASKSPTSPSLPMTMYIPPCCSQSEAIHSCRKYCSCV